MNIVVAASFLIVILLNIIIVRYIIRRAIKKHVKRELGEKDLTYSDWKWAGFFAYGDFDEKPQFTLITMGNGSPDISIFLYVYYSDGISKKRVTVKIETLFFFIRKIKYSHEL